MSDLRSESQAGFTLLEMIVAFAILAISLSVLFGVFANGLRQAGQAETTVVAGSMLQSLLAEVGRTKPVQEGRTEGKFANGLRWRLDVEPYGTREDRQQWPVGAYKVLATVSWDDGLFERSVVVTTLHLGQKDAP